MGRLQSKIPTEGTHHRPAEFELAEQASLRSPCARGATTPPSFPPTRCKSQKPSAKPEEKQAELNYKLGTQIPYMFIINRLAHYIKVYSTGNIGSWTSRKEMEAELNNWISQYIANQENPSPEVRARRPLRMAEITVEDVEGEPGWYRVSMSVVPHFKYMEPTSLCPYAAIDKQ